LGNPEGRDSFSKECIDTINQNLTEKRNFLCIIAGYKDALDQCFFSYNEGLRRRFTFRYDIKGYTPNELMEIFLMKVKKDGWVTEFDIEDTDSEQRKIEKTILRNELKSFFEQNMKYFPHYGGDIETFFLKCKLHHGKRVLFMDPSVRKVLTVLDLEKGFETYVGDRKYKEDIDRGKMSESAQRMYL
jgi:hypothetical protein